MKHKIKSQLASIPSPLSQDIPKTDKRGIPTNIVPGTSFTPVSTQDDADREFIDAVLRPAEGANDITRDFLAIMNRLSGSVTKIFSFDDVMRQANALELPSVLVVKLFEQWKNFMLRKDRIFILRGCYDNEHYQFRT